MTSSLFRHPRTRQERRIRAGEHKVKFRARWLPTAWDDKQPKTQRSWKAHRLTKWR